MVDMNVRDYEQLLVDVEGLAKEREKSQNKSPNSVSERDDFFLKELVFRKYPTIQSCADVCQMDRSTLSKIVNNRLEPTSRQKIEISKALGFDDSREVFR